MLFWLTWLGSTPSALTIATLFICPRTDESTFTRISTVASVPTGMSPKPQVTVPVRWLQVPRLVVTVMKSTPFGNVSTRLTDVALEGPVLETCSVYFRSVPATTGSGSSSFTTGNAPIWSTLVMSISRLSSLSESGCSPVTSAVFWIVPTAPASTVTEIVILALAPTGRTPRLHTTGPPSSHALPWLEDADSRLTSDGKVSVTITPVALDGPSFVITNT